MRDQIFLILDYETRSRADLKKTGSFEYAAHPSTRILCVAYRIGTKDGLAHQLKNKTPCRIWYPAFTAMPADLRIALSRNDVLISAHNAGFEQAITRFVLKINIPIHRWFCTAAMAASFALPRSLDGASSALGLSFQKDKEGHRLMLKMSKPRKPTKNNPAIWHNKISDLMRLGKYCQSDVDAETELFLTLPMLSESERKIWLLDQKINQYGFQVDRPLVEKALKLIPEEIGRLDLEAQSLTCGAIRSTTQRNETLNFLIRHGVAISDLQAKTLSDFLKSDRSGMETPEALRVIEIRQTVSKTSTAKFTAFEQRSRFDGRCRENLLYYGASTGRWAGKGVQPQNFPRGSIKDPELACDVVLNHSLEFIRAMYGDPMETFSSILRGCIRAPEGFELFCGDWASIEVRVLFWCAHHALGLKAFVDGRDLYLELAPAIYGRMVTKEDKEERNTAKRAVLGCGYGMGDKRFRETCEEYGEPVSEEIAKRAVKAYRKTHAPVVTLWGDVEKAAIRAVRGTPGTAGRCKWFMEGRFLKCRLPSGRELAYCDPVVKWEATRFGTKHPKLSFMGVNSISKKWQRESTWGGKLVENIVQAISADLMREAMLRVDAEGYRIILTVHDELLAEKELSETSAEEFARLMAVAPGWAADLPLKVEGFKCLRYQK